MTGTEPPRIMEIHSENTFARWTAPESPFEIQYSARVLDDIRLAVMDAFFSLPRGGAEIGGVLLGRRDNGRIAITDSITLPCEHAFGPSFSLSAHDHAALEDLLATAKRNPAATPVGWWHSHTRSEIFLSDADQEIHRRFFPESWQIALVLKPHTFEPTRAGFFFREKDGSIHGAASYREFVLDALPMRAVASAAGAAIPPATSRHDMEGNGPVIDIAAVSTPEPPPPVAQPEPEPPRRIEPEAPQFLAAQPAPSRRWIAWVAVALGVAVGIGGFQTRASWLPAFGSSTEAPLGLNAIDREGQLQIRWNGASPGVRAAKGGTLVITDGPTPLRIPLDAAHLQNGSFTYG